MTDPNNSVPGNQYGAPATPDIPAVPSAPAVPTAPTVPAAPEVPQQPTDAGQPQYAAPQFAAQPAPQVPPQQPPFGAAPAGAPAGAPAPQFNAANAMNQLGNVSDKLSGTTVNVGSYKFDMISIITFIGAILTVIATLVPFVSINLSVMGQTLNESQSLIKGGDGWFFILFAVAAVVLTIVRQHLAALIVSVLDLGLGIFEMMDAGKKIDEAVGQLAGYGLGDEFRNAVSYGAGPWLVFLGAAAMIVGTGLAFFNMTRAKKGAAPAVPVAPQFGAPAPAFGAPAPAAGAPAAAPAPFGAPSAPADPFAAPAPVSAPSDPFQQQPAAPAAADDEDEFGATVLSTSTPQQPTTPPTLPQQH
ncbi:ABC transporter permease [Bifidobacterium jacchi]|uniref:ABC transporter permease n=1 Tax=Bifidobacterium jacchi TaxID=2490545 RepID=A0A5N5RIF5_9BIFI|nr:ABC transporter permease [Bifidobacterium jacchi]KAB5607065.1 ABC transporter permease [Bifidobacterium jacchi]